MNTAAPAFAGTLPSAQTVSINSVKTYTIPAYSGCSVTVTFLPTSLTFISLSGNTFSFSPTLYSHIGTHSITVYLTDSASLQSNSVFTLTVNNLAPQVTSTVPVEVLGTFGVSSTYTLPTAIDPEGMAFTTTLVTSPSFVTLLSSTQITINPINCNTDLGSFTVTIKLEDGEPKST